MSLGQGLLELCNELFDWAVRAASALGRYQEEPGVGQPGVRVRGTERQAALHRGVR